MTTFLGVPLRRPSLGHHQPSESPLRGSESFPKAAHHELANQQLRRNLAHATSTIQAKRALVVGEMPTGSSCGMPGRRSRPT